MILITLGTQKFQFNRLLKKIDQLIKDELITDEVFAQIGYSDYIPLNFKYSKFLDREEFVEKIKQAEIIVTHGGTGAIITGIKNDKKVIAIPRLNKYQEHVDDHQMQIVEMIEKMQLISAVYDIEDLGTEINNIKNKKFKKYISNTENIITSIKKYIEVN